MILIYGNFGNAVSNKQDGDFIEALSYVARSVTACVHTVRNVCLELFVFSAFICLPIFVLFSLEYNLLTFFLFIYQINLSIY